MSDQTKLMDVPSRAQSLAQLQGLRRRAAVKRAKLSPFFRGKLDHLDLDRITAAEEWAGVPILDKQELRNMDSETFYTQFCTAPREDIIDVLALGRVDREAVVLPAHGARHPRCPAWL